MGYYDALVAAWNGATQPAAGVTGTALTQGMTTAQKLGAVNGWTVPGPNQDVRVSTVQGKLMLAGAWLKLKAYAAANPTTQTGEVAQMLLDMCNSPSLQTFQMSDGPTYQNVQGMLSLLAQDPATGVTSALEAELLALASTTQPWWQANAYARPFDLGDCAAAGVN